MAQRNFRHGYFGTPTYKSWSEMKYRCGNKKRKDYVDISYCIEWEKFENFLADMNERPVGKTLDRFPNNNGNYCKENCRWATPKEQANNRSNARLFEYNGKKLTLTDWSKKLGIKRSTLSQRFYCYKWSLKKTLQKGGY